MKDYNLRCVLVIDESHETIGEVEDYVYIKIVFIYSYLIDKLDVIKKRHIVAHYSRAHRPNPFHDLVRINRFEKCLISWIFFCGLKCFQLFISLTQLDQRFNGPD